jgi:antitoxin component YwqK of YwqJK toxin-antitoxin module
MKNYVFVFIAILMFGCNAESENNTSKRNADWIWWIDEHTDKGEWIKSGNQTTVKDGSYTMFYFNGNVYSKGKLRNGAQIDTIFGYDLDGKLDCYDVIVSKDQKLFYVINDGPFIKYFPDGKKAIDGYIRNHKTGDYWKEYNKRSILIHETNFTDSPKYITKFYDDGTLKMQFLGDVFYSDSFHNWDLNNGMKREYYSGGKLKKEEGLRNGKLDGMNTEYFENGQIKVKVEFLEGKPLGLLNMWYENGNLKTSINFTNGNENGIGKTFFENGNTKMIANFKNGKIDGKMIQYDSLGRNPKVYLYKDGVEIEK